MTTASRAPADHSDTRPRAGDVPPGPPLLDLDATFRKALPCILTMARRRGFTEDEQHEIAQRVGVLLVARKDAHDPARGTPVEWAIGIAKNVFREVGRARRTQRRYFDDLPLWSLESQPSDDLTPEERVRAHDALGIILAALTEQQRKVLELTVEGCTAKQVAEILDLSVTTVELRLKEARVRLAAVLKRLGEDPGSITNVRGAVLPFLGVEDIERAWRARLDSTGPRAPAARAGLPVVKLGAAGIALYAAGVITGLALAGPGGPHGNPRSSIAADLVPAAATSSAADLPAMAPAPLVPAGTARAAAAPATAPSMSGTVSAASDIASASAAAPAPVTAPPAPAAEVDPETASESLLLQMAISAPPATALHLAGVHGRRFPSRSVEKREMVYVRAFAALGRRSEAAAHARALKGTVYEQQAEETIGGSPP